MGLNIKSEETNRLARELSALSGESLTGAITVAIRERIARLRGRTGLAERLLRIGKLCAAELSEKDKLLDHGDMLYDAQGLPR